MIIPTQITLPPSLHSGPVLPGLSGHWHSGDLLTGQGVLELGRASLLRGIGDAAASLGRERHHLQIPRDWWEGGDPLTFWLLLDF